MCDYSLMGFPNRLANEKDDLVVHRFSTGTVGLVAACSDQCPDEHLQPGFGAIWSALKRFFRDEESDRAIAVCVAPGARLLVDDIPDDIQRLCKSGPLEAVTFTQLTAAANMHRDAIRFDNGAELLLQRLREGQRIRVLRLALPEPGEVPVSRTVGSTR